MLSMKQLKERHDKRKIQKYGTLQPGNGVCPDCGRCPTCGKRHWPRPLLPFDPMPYNPPYPYRPIGPYWGGTTY